MNGYLKVCHIRPATDFIRTLQPLGKVQTRLLSVDLPLKPSRCGTAECFVKNTYDLKVCTIRYFSFFTEVLQRKKYAFHFPLLVLLSTKLAQRVLVVFCYLSCIALFLVINKNAELVHVFFVNVVKFVLNFVSPSSQKSCACGWILSINLHRSTSKIWNQLWDQVKVINSFLIKTTNILKNVQSWDVRSAGVRPVSWECSTYKTDSLAI